MSVEQLQEMLRSVEQSEDKLKQQCAAVDLARRVLPSFNDAVSAQMRWRGGEQPTEITLHAEALQQYFAYVPGLEAAYHAVLASSPELLDDGNYFGSP